jgi:hypothetical protein
MIGSAAAQQITTTEKEMTTTGTVPVAATPEQAKVNSEVAEIVGRSSLDSMAINKQGATKENANLTASYIQTAIQDRGPRLESIVKDEAKLKAALNNMPDGIKAEYLAVVNKHIDNVISPQGQLANNVGIFASIRKTVENTEWYKRGNRQQQVLQVDNNGYITVLGNYGGNNLLSPVFKTVPALAGFSTLVDAYTIGEKQSLLKVRTELNNIVTTAAAASGTDRKAMAQRFADAYNMGLRPDGTTKGTGWMGLIETANKGVMSEVSVGVEIKGKETLLPLIVPTLTTTDINWLKTHDPSSPDFMKTLPKEIMDKAVAHAEKRIAEGKSPFIEKGESPVAPVVDVKPSPSQSTKSNDKSTKTTSNTTNKSNVDSSWIYQQGR